MDRSSRTTTSAWLLLPSIPPWSAAACSPLLPDTCRCCRVWFASSENKKLMVSICADDKEEITRIEAFLNMCSQYDGIFRRVNYYPSYSGKWWITAFHFWIKLPRVTTKSRQTRVRSTKSLEMNNLINNSTNNW